ncbi:MAG: hypothetical protein WAV90_00935, partial [Gordonia amarae]
TTLAAMGDIKYHEPWGWLSKEQLRVYREHHVNTAEHDELERWFGGADRDSICAAVTFYSSGSQSNIGLMRRVHRDSGNFLAGRGFPRPFRMP